MAIALVVSGKAGSSGGAVYSSGSLDTSGANLIVVGTVIFGGGVSTALSDNKSNPWTPLTKQASTPGGSNDTNIQLFYCLAPTVGSGHTFSEGTASNFGAMGILAFSGAAAYEAESGGGYPDATTSHQPGSLTPAANNEVLVAATGHRTDPGAMAIDSGFTIAQTQIYSSGNNLDLSIAYLIETTATAKNPTWSWVGGTRGADVMATFTASAGGPSVTYPELERGIRGLARGVTSGLARTFVRKDRIFVPAYSRYDLKAAA